MTVWKAALKTIRAKNMAIFGTSAGGALTLEMVLRAKQDGLAAAGRHRAGHADVRCHQGRRQLLHQRDGRQRAGLAGRLLRRRRQGLRQRPRPEGPAAVAGLRRHARLPADHPDHRHARPAAEQHRARASQAAPGRRRGGAAGLRGPVARALHPRRHRAGDQGSVRGNRGVSSTSIWRNSSGEFAPRLPKFTAAATASAASRCIGCRALRQQASWPGLSRPSMSS